MGLKYFLICVFILFFVIINARAQEINSAGDSSSGTFIAMPLVNNNPVMKFSLGGIGMYMFPFSKSDTISPPSTVMLLGLYSTNNSYIFLMPTALFFGNDYYRITAAVITSRINNNFVYDYDGSDVTLVYSELRWMYIAEFSLQVINDFYTGLLYAGFLTNYK